MKSLVVSAAPFPKSVSWNIKLREQGPLWLDKFEKYVCTSSPPFLWYFENHISILKVHESESVSHSAVSDSLQPHGL